MTPQEIIEKLKSKFGETITDAKAEGVVDPFVKVKAESMKEFALFLRDDTELQLDFLMCLSGIDLGKGNLGVVYNLYSMNKKHKITIKVEVQRDKKHTTWLELLSPVILICDESYSRRIGKDIRSVKITKCLSFIKE